jgi:hypothetical protein
MLRGQVIRVAYLTVGLAFVGGMAFAQERTELGVADSFVVEGTVGTKADPDVKLAGYTMFGTNGVGAWSVTSGVGNVYIQNSLEVGSNLFLHGNGIVFPDATTQATAYVAGGSLLSGECDTNRQDMLFSTNYVITGVKVMQSPIIPQLIQVYVNGSVVDAFSLSSNTAARDVSFNLAAFDRLGISCTNINGTILFCFEGRRR